MKRTCLKRKTPLKAKSGFSEKARQAPRRSKRALGASKPSKTSKSSSRVLKLLKIKIWALCRELAGLLYNDADGTSHCYTCGRECHGLNRHLGHFVPSAACGAYLRYDMRNLRWQCYYCNINLGGNGSAYYRNMVEREGQEYVDRIFRDKNIIVKESDYIAELIHRYEEQIASIKSQRVYN